MSYQVLARKWRPRNFDTLVGQEHVVRALAHALTDGRLHHAYLFTGTRGVGKTTIARILAKSLNCETGITASPCGQCATCQEIDSGRFIDLLEVDAATNTKVDEMRQLLENAVYAPTRGRFKVYVIDEVHMLSNAAFNAMLKTLEEPPEHVKFILATTDPQKIPVTVLSRCLQFNLKQMTTQLISAHLKNVLALEKIVCETPALHLIAHAASGSMRDALSLLDQAIAHGAGEVKEAEVRDMLGVVDHDYLLKLLEALVAENLPDMIAIAQNMALRSLSFSVALEALARLLTEIQLAQLAKDALADDLPEKDRVLALAAAMNPEYVQLAYQIAIVGRNELSLAPDDYAGFTMSLMRLFAFMPKEEGVQERAKTLAAAPLRAVKPAVKEVSLAPTPPKEKPNPSALPEVPTPLRQAAAPELEAPSQTPPNWHDLLPQLGLTGMNKSFGEHCELIRIEESAVTLRLSPAQKHLHRKSAEDALAQAMSTYFGKTMHLVLRIEEVERATPAMVQAEQKDARQQAAIAAIENDPFVQSLKNQFNAKVIENSINPIT